MKQKLTKKDILILVIFVIGSAILISWQQQLVAEDVALNNPDRFKIDENVTAKYGIVFCDTNGICIKQP